VTATLMVMTRLPRFSVLTTGIRRERRNFQPRPRQADRDAKIVDFYLYLAAAFVTVRQLIQRARKRYRWDTRPTTKRLK